MLKRLLFALTGCLLWTGSAYAQTCLGLPTFEQAKMRAVGQAAFSSEAHVFGGGISGGTSQIFGSGTFLLQGASDADGTAKGFLVSAGTELPIGAAKKFFACPLVSIARTSGIEVIVGDSASATAISFGGQVGFEATKSGKTSIVPTFGFQITNQRLKVGSDFDAFSSTFGNLILGVGIVFDGRMSIVPGLVVPLGEDAAPVTFVTMFQIKIGQ